MRVVTMLFALCALALGAVAEECVPTTSQSFLPGDSYYMTDPTWLVLCHPTCLPEFWVYEESNGIEGWQRADEQHDDTCGGQIPGDTILF